MKIIKRFYDEDLRALLMEHYNLRPDQVTSIYTEELDEREEPYPVFYIEVEGDGE